LLALAGGEIERVEAGLVAEAARQGDPLARQVIERAAAAFATGIFNILMLFQPEMIVLSGGVMRSLDLFMPAIEKVIQAADAYIPARQVRILPAALGYYAGIYGAAYAILKATQ
jgi:glucokinase